MSTVLGLHQPVVSPLLVGRESQLAALTQLLTHLRAGQGALVLLSGEAGIGKSRLVDEVVRRCLAEDTARVLIGRCFEQDRALPFAPIVDLLRGALRDVPAHERAERVAAFAPELTRLLPELAPAPQSATLPADPDDERRRIFAGLLALLERETRRAPHLLVIEDLHWSDDTSLDLLQRLARRAPALPLLVVLTYRDDEIHPALHRMLATLDRERLAIELTPGRLSLEQVNDMLRAIFGQQYPIRRDFLRAVHVLTDGNPFFIEEVIRSLLASGDIYLERGSWQRKELSQLRIPRSVADAVQHRSQNLSPLAAEVLRVAAVTGQRVAFDILQALTGADEAPLLDALRELIAAQLLVEADSDRFGFRHALTREAVYGQLLGRERRTLHQRVALALERMHAGLLEPVLPDLAYHFYAAEDWERAHRYALQAAARAEALSSPDAVRTHLDRADDASRKLGLPPDHDLLRRRAAACAILGEFGQAERDLQTVLDAAILAGDRQAEWQAVVALGELFTGRDYERAGAMFTHALALAREHGDEAAVAQSLLGLANWQVNVDAIDDARRSLEEALAMFQRLGNRPKIALTLDLLGICADLGGDVPLMRHRLEQALREYRALGDRVGAASVLASLCSTCFAAVFDACAVPLVATLEEAQAWHAEALLLAREVGWRAGEAYAQLTGAGVLIHRGYTSAALALARPGVEIASEIEHQEWQSLAGLVLGVVRYQLLEYASAAATLAEAAAQARAGGSLHFEGQAQAYQTFALLELGATDEAAAVLADMAPNLPLQSVSQRMLWLARAALALQQQQPAVALAICDRLFSTALHAAQAGDIPRLSLIRGNALAMLGQDAAAEAELLAGLAGAELRGLSPLVWRIQAALAHFYLARGRGPESAAQAEQAQTTLAWLADQLNDVVQRRGFVERASALLPNPGQPAPQPATLLTPREAEVAELIAAGYSNRDIAEQLYVGARTVETHVSHILSKLGFASRAQIAAWVVAQRAKAERTT